MTVLEQRGKDDLQHLEDSIRRRLTWTPASEDAELPNPDKPTKTELEPLRARLAKGANAAGFGYTFERLTLFDPDLVAEYLRSWVNPGKDGKDLGLGYVLGSYFGNHCGHQRKRHFQTLAQAKNDFIRVAGAVYLSREEDTSSAKPLEQLVDLEGDPGVWAALNLVRRGRKTAMPRALRVFNSRGNDDLSSACHRNLQKRLLLLLANSCKASGIEMPDVAIGPGETLKMLEWWTANQDKIVIHPPPREIVRRQEVDL